MTNSPTVEEALTVNIDPQKAEKDARELVARVQEYQRDMCEYLDVKLEWWKRRFALHERYNEDPWPGASTMWLPMSDLYINQAKPFYSNLMFGGPRVATMQPENAAGVDNVPAAEHMMEHMLRGGGKHAMPDFPQQKLITDESMLTYGVGIVKTYYSYRSRAATETLRRDDLPGVLGKLVFKPGLSDDDRLGIQQQFDPNMLNPPEVVAFFGEQINPINSTVFKRHEQRIADEVRRMFDLDEDDKLDKAAFKKIMSYLRRGTPEASIAVTKREVIEDVSRIVNIPIQDLILPPQALADFERAEVIAHKHRKTRTEIEELAEDSLWDKKAVEALLSMPSGPNSSDHDLLTFEQNERRQIYGTANDDDLFEYWQIYSYEDLEGNGFKELTVTEVDPFSSAVLRKAPFPADHGQMPFSAITFEMNDASLRGSRGIPEILKDLEEHVAANFRHMENSMQITGVPSFAADRNVVKEFEDRPWFPGVTIPTDDPQHDIKQIQMTPVELQFQATLGFLQGWAERIAGGFDAEPLGSNDAPERRTATESSIVDQTRGRTAGMRGMLHAKQWERPLSQAWSLWRQFGPKSAYVHITGEQPQTITQAQTRGRFFVKPYAAVGANDPAFRARQASVRLQEGIQLAPLLQGHPSKRLNLARLLEDKWRLEDPIATARSLEDLSQEEQQALAQQLQAQMQKAEQIEQLAQQAIANTPTDPEGLVRLMNEMARRMPHGSLQEILQEAEAARGAANAAGIHSGQPQQQQGA
jgi:hypothetical protein